MIRSSAPPASPVRYLVGLARDHGAHAEVLLDGLEQSLPGREHQAAINEEVRLGHEEIMAQAKNSFNFTVFGRVDFTDFTSDTFRVDDGSGNPILVKAVNHGVNPFEYVKATGRLTPNTTPPTLDSQAEKIEKLEGF